MGVGSSWSWVRGLDLGHLTLGLWEVLSLRVGREVGDRGLGLREGGL